MENIASKLNAMDPGVRERDAGCSLNKLLRQSVTQPVWHREWHEDREHGHSGMLARMKELNESDQSDECNQELNHGSGRQGKLLA